MKDNRNREWTTQEDNALKHFMDLGYSAKKIHDNYGEMFGRTEKAISCRISYLNKQQIEKIKDVLEEIATMGNLQKEAETRLQKLQLRYTQLTKECNGLTEQIRNITKTLEGLNIDKPRLNKEINIINKEMIKDWSDYTKTEEKYKYMKNKIRTDIYLLLGDDLYHDVKTFFEKFHHKKV